MNRLWGGANVLPMKRLHIFAPNKLLFSGNQPIVKVSYVSDYNGTVLRIVKLLEY